MAAEQDIWAGWLLNRRQGGPALPAAQASQLRAVRDRVLDGADLQPDYTVLDVGCGDGLIGFGAIERLGPKGVVIFSDVSAELLSHCATQAAALGCLERCRFVHASADDLNEVPASAVDVVTTRAVLTYVADRAAALAEFARVLRPGGRVSIHEPINRRWKWSGLLGYEPEAVDDLLSKVVDEAARLAPGEDVMLNFDEGDLLNAALAAGLMPAAVELLMEVRPIEAGDWEAFYGSAPNPFAPTVSELLEAVLDERDRARFSSALRLAVESGRGSYRYAAVYLRAQKPFNVTA